MEGRKSGLEEFLSLELIAAWEGGIDSGGRMMIPEWCKLVIQFGFIG